MKQSAAPLILTITSLLMSAIITAGCSGHQTDDRQVFPEELVSFEPWPDNPVFAGTGADTWDRHIRERGWIMRETDGWHMWYTGYNNDFSGTKYLGYATSTNGYTWTRHEDNPIYTARWVEDMMIVREGDTLYMVAEGRNDIARLMVSHDGVSWIDNGDLDVRKTDGTPIDPGPYGTPTLWREDGLWYLFYERNDGGIWLAASEDMTVWTNRQDDPVIAMGPEAYDINAVALNQIVKHNGRYYAYYHASAHDPWRDWSTCVAVSEDLVHWTKFPGNPIVTGDKSSGILVHDGERYRLYTMHPDVRVWLPKKR